MEINSLFAIIAIIIGIILSYKGRKGFKQHYESFIGYKRYSGVSLLFIISGILLYFAYDSWETILIILGYIFFGIGIWQLITTKNICNKKIKELENYNKNIELEKQNEQYDNNSKQIYNICLKHKLTSFDTEDNKNNLMIITDNFGVNNIDEAIKMFVRGQELLKNEEKEYEGNKIKTLRIRDKELYEKALEKSKIVGKEKYIQKLEKDIELGKKALKLCDSNEKLALANMNAIAKKSDWAIWGGIANGIAGSAAGVATAIDIQRQNEKEKINTLKLREQGKQQYNNILQIKRDLPRILDEEQKAIDIIKEKLYSDKDINNIFNNICIKDIKYEIKKNKNFIVEIDIDTKKVKLIDSFVNVDGTLSIKILDENEKIVATGLYSAPGFDVWDFGEVGFNTVDKIKTICITPDELINEIIDTVEYKCIIEPVSLWLIEK